MYNLKVTIDVQCLLSTRCALLYHEILRWYYCQPDRGNSHCGSESLIHHGWLIGNLLSEKSWTGITKSEKNDRKDAGTSTINKTSSQYRWNWGYSQFVLNFAMWCVWKFDIVKNWSWIFIRSESLRKILHETNYIPCPVNLTEFTQAYYYTLFWFHLMAVSSRSSSPAKHGLGKD